MIIGAIVILTLLLSAFFSGSEIAYVASNRLRVETLARHTGRIGAIASDFLRNPSKLLTTTLVGNNLALVAYSTAVAFVLEPSLHHLYTETLGLGSSGASDVLVLATQTLIAGTVVLFVGEIIPKSMMREIPNRAAIAMALPLRITYLTLHPLVKLAEWTSNLLIRAFGVHVEDLSEFLRRDFEQIIREGRLAGQLELDEEEQALLSNVFAMDTIRVKESMVPRTDVAAVEDSASLELLRQKFIETGYSRLPVYHENIDSIVGIAFAHDLFQNPTSLDEILRPVQFVPDSKNSKDLLREFLSENISVAIVLDEYGGMAGLVTREDLLEELFGDIKDEFDADSDTLRQLDERTYLVSGRVDIDVFAEKFGIALPDGDYETIAGYVLEHAGSIPPPRTELVAGGFRFNILRSTPNRIELVRMTVLDDPGDVSVPS